MIILRRIFDQLRRFRTDKDGTVSWEYLLVAAVVIIAVGTAFGGAGGPLETALANGITDVVSDFAAEI